MWNQARFRCGLLFAALMLASCAGGGGGGGLSCSGCASSCGGNPNYKFKGKPMEGGIRARVTQPGVDFFTRNLKPIIESSLKKAGQTLACSGSGLTIGDQFLGNGPKNSRGQYVRPDASNCNSRYKFPNKAECSGSTPGKTWFYTGLKKNNFCGTLNTQSLKIGLNESDNSVNVSFSFPEIQVRSRSPEIGVCYKQKVNATLVKGTACGGAFMSLQNVRLRLTNLTGNVKMRFYSDQKTGQVGLKVAKVEIGGSTRFEMLVDRCNAVEIHIMRIPIINYDVKVKLGSSFCSGVIRLVTGLINASKFIQPLIFRALQGVITNQVNKFNLLADAKMEMEVPLSQLLGGLGLPGMDKARPMGVFVGPGNSMGVKRGGLNLDLKSGFETASKHPCVPARPFPPTKPGPVPSMVGSYHLGMALSRAATNQAMWAAYHTGALCIGLTSSDVYRLSNGGFPLNAGVLALLAPKLQDIVPGDAPVMIALRPTEAPRVEFGTGKTVGGKKDSTIQLQMNGFGVEFYVMLHDRFVRLFKLLVDLRLGVSVIVTPKNALEITIDTDTLKLNNARTTQANLVDAADIKQLLPVLVNLITNTLGNSKLSFPIEVSKPLSNALGVPISVKINDVKRDGPARDWLALTMTLSNNAQPQMPEVRTMAEPNRNDLGLFKRVKGKVIPTGEVKLQVPEFLGSFELEYQYYVGFGAWSDFHPAPGGILRVRSPFLKILGNHNIYVRSRIRGEYRSLDTRPVKVSVIFDPLAPKVELHNNGGFVRIDASDYVTAKQDLQYAYRAGSDGEWVSLAGNNLHIQPLLKKHQRVQIRVSDKNGNHRIVNYNLIRRTAGKNVQQTIKTEPSRNQGGSGTMAMGCSAGPAESSSPVGLVWLLLLLPLAIFRRRR